MRRTFTRRTRNLGALAGALFFVLLAGCSDETPVGPVGGSGDSGVAPVLPSPERLDFDFSFFEDKPVLERASKRNFFNAYVRALTVQAITRLVLTPPVLAFSLALHTVPSPQPDGSFIWVYTCVQGDEEAQIRLRGLRDGDRVVWELRVKNLHEIPPVDNEVWFEGETWADGEAGFWRFYDFHLEGDPLVARIDWGDDADGEFLRFTDLYENPQDTLEYRSHGDLGSITFVDADASTEEWFIRWNEADGTGSLKAPRYNNGEEACWDENQNDCVCPGA